MVRRFKPAAKYRRGSRTHGWGRVGQHRKSGSSGGKGMVGFHKHKWSLVMKYGEPGSGWPFYGKHGFRRPNSAVWKAINVGDLPALLSSRQVAKEGDRYVIDLRKFGYNKLLGGGRIGLPVVVYVEAATKAAVEKVARAGGEVRIAS